MSKKRYKPEEIVAKLRQVDVLSCVARRVRGLLRAGCFFPAPILLRQRLGRASRLC
jgi:hypothetical protein